MKYLLTLAVLMLAQGVFANESAQLEEPVAAAVEEGSGTEDWPTLDDWWKENKLNEGKVSAEVLIGYEYSDLSDNGTKAAHGLITRTRLNYRTANYEGFDGMVQAQYVGPINDHYSYPGGGDPNYDPIGDPEAFRLHQVYLAYTGHDFHARLGSQEILLDNQRFIGNVGWRLNGQSFNAGLASYSAGEDLTLLYAYADSINDTLGEINHARQYHMLNAEYLLGEANRVSGYAYLQRNDGIGTLEKLDTYGLRAWGTNGKFSHDALLAFQRDAYFGSLFGGFILNGFNLGAGAEFISGGSDSGEQFQTLNGTAHKFNGWADQFTGTGGGLEGGLVDIYGKASAEATDRLTCIGALHCFTTANTTDAGFDGPYGYEIDASARYEVCSNFDVLAKVAVYIEDGNNPDNFTADETVFWLRGTMRF